MSSIADIAETQRLAITSLNQRMADFEEHLKISSAGADLSGLHKEFTFFKEHVWSVLSALQLQIAEVSRSVDVIEMRHRKKFLLLGGVPEKPGERLPESVASLLQDKLGIGDLAPSSLTVCHRLGAASEGHTRPILLQFKESAIRGQIWKTKTKLKGTSYVLSEYLTRRRQSAFTTARKLFGVTNVWTMDGNINVKLPNGKRRRVFTADEVIALGAEHGKSLDQVVLPDLNPGSNNTSPAPTQAHTRSRRLAKKK